MQPAAASALHKPTKAPVRMTIRECQLHAYLHARRVSSALLDRTRRSTNSERPSVRHDGHSAAGPPPTVLFLKGTEGPTPALAPSEETQSAAILGQEASPTQSRTSGVSPCHQHKSLRVSRTSKANIGFLSTHLFTIGYTGLSGCIARITCRCQQPV